MERFKPLIVMPALNEEKTLNSILLQLVKICSVLVVDDGSTDSTASIVSSSGASLLQHQTNKGYAAAINSGFQYAEMFDFTHVITFDADGEHDPYALIEILNLVKKNSTSMVIGIRVNQRRLSEHIVSYICKLIWGVDDIFCGLKVYPIDLWHQYNLFESYDSCGTELFLHGVKDGRRVVQTKITGKKRESKSRFDTPIRAHLRILKQIYYMLGLKC